MYCWKCGFKLPEGAKFCPQCGTKVRILNAATNQGIEGFSARDRIDQGTRKEDEPSVPDREIRQTDVPSTPAETNRNTYNRPVLSGEDESKNTRRTEKKPQIPPEQRPQRIAASQNQQNRVGKGAAPVDRTAPVDQRVRSSGTDNGDRRMSSGSFMDLTQYVVDEKVSAFTFANAYKVYDINGNVVGAIQQVNISSGAKAARLLLGSSAKSLQSFQFNIMDSRGNVIASISRGGMGGGVKAMRNIAVQNQNGAQIGKVTIRPGLNPVFEVTDAYGTVICNIASDWKRYNFTVTSPDGSQIGEVKKKWTGLVREVFTTADRYLVTLDGSLVGIQRIVAAAATITIDMMMHEMS